MRKMLLKLNYQEELELPGRTCRVLVGNDRLKAENLTFGVTEVPPKTKMSPHKHVQEEVIFVLSGHGETKVDEHVEEIKEGTAIYLPSNVEHFIENKSNRIMRFTFAFSP